MGWYKIAQCNVYQKIKKILKTHPFTQKIMNDYNLSLSEIDDNLELEVRELRGKFAEGNGNKIILDPKLFRTKDFFDDNFHFVIHEFYHWIRRRKEAKFYFHDEEEIESFVLAIAWEMINNKEEKIIETKLYPIIEAHFKDKKRAKQLFKKMIDQAHKICLKLNKNKDR